MNRKLSIMKQYILRITGSMCFLFIAILCKAQQTGTLTIEAINFTNNKGSAIIQLFREQDDVPEKPFKNVKAEIVHGKAQIIFNEIPYGNYAAILFHDENANGILDHKLGFPNEDMGFSNQWKLSLFSGMPTFTKLKFSFKQQDTPYVISIH
ncbi:MAG: DUF2141 domain-containing protein [Chryseolinea sp.]